MADTLLIFAPDKKNAATRLAEGLSEQGYAVDLRDVDDADGLADALEDRSAPATVLVWSRPLVSAVLGRGLDKVRHHPNLVEVTVDGITPPSAGETTRFILLSGWRGQPFHPGWQRLLAELERHCGQKSATRPAPEGPRRAAKRQSSGSSRRRLGFAALAIGGVAALAGLAAIERTSGGSSSSRSPVPSAHPVAARTAPRAVAPATPAAPATGAPVTSEAGSSAAAGAAGDARAGADVNGASPATKAGGVPSMAPAAPAAPSQASSHARAKAHVTRERSAPAGKHYSRRFSGTMRLFCERSGRSTPECRTFLRALKRS